MALLKFEAVGVSKNTTPGFVYFIRAEVGGPVKIGWATNVGSRLYQMQAHNPFKLTVLGGFAGSGKDERVLHDRFAAHRLHGEWFEPVEELLAEATKHAALEWRPMKSKRQAA